MMNDEVFNSSYKNYRDVAKGFAELSNDNFYDVHKLLPDVETMRGGVNVFADTLLKLLSNTDPALAFNERDFGLFAENPSDFSKKVLPGTMSQLNLSKVCELQELVIELYNHFAVSIRIVNFLMDKEAQNVAINKELLKKHVEVVNKLSVFENVKQLEPLTIPQINKKHEPLPIFSDEENENIKKNKFKPKKTEIDKPNIFDKYKKSFKQDNESTEED